MPVVVLPEWLPDGLCGAAVVVVVGPGELVRLVLFRVTGSQPEKGSGFGVGLGAAAWFALLDAAALLGRLPASVAGCAKLPELFIWTRSADRTPVDFDGEGLREELREEGMRHE
ncbi:hypothetical protein [Sorangium atrum]|uniref:Uncharacterized protein n=1 Tax=Sorangium atrum TaxID=2995308 RepID=A0ABT5CGJ4_9BACT|nr:hypothetical protein [Sorangium aterium]MDC0685554.1 hypothetical protein [Sorangium aterium]